MPNEIINEGANEGANEGESTKRRTIIQRRLKRARHKRNFVLRLTSMVDVFTILLIFLIKNFSTGSEITLMAKNLQLPVSIASQAPEASTTISATQQDVLIDGEFVDTIENFDLQKDLLNPKVYEKLLRSKEKFLMLIQPGTKFQGKIIIQADKRIPYKIIKKLIYTCGQAEFGKISLHVLNKPSLPTNTTLTNTTRDIK